MNFIEFYSDWMDSYRYVEAKREVVTFEYKSEDIYYLENIKKLYRVFYNLNSLIEDAYVVFGDIDIDKLKLVRRDEDE